jgi:hypothetical protein
MKDNTVTGLQLPATGNQQPATKKKKAVHTYGAKDIMRWKFDAKNRHLEPLDNNATNMTLLHSNRDLVTATQPPTLNPAPVVAEDRYEAKEEEHTASVLDLVEELRARRAMQEPTVRPAPAKGRTSLPSWDEIVLGTSSESDSDQRDS